MKSFIMFLFRTVLCALLELIIYRTTHAQPSLFLAPQSRITVGAHAKVTCHSVTWLGDAVIRLEDSAVITMQGSPRGSDTTSRFFILAPHASIKMRIDSLAQYLFPVGYAPNKSSYRGFSLDMKSLGQTGTGDVSVQLMPTVSGVINYDRYFPSQDTNCVAGSRVVLNCLSQDGWHCEGPSDYEYVATAYTAHDCGGTLRRLIKTGTGTHAWQDSIESVVGDFPENLCDHSDWGGTSNYVPGGTYRDFSDFAIVSSTTTLPVTLLDIHAEVVDQRCIRVSWSTASEIDNDKFLVGRSIDGYTFTVIGEVSGSGTSTMEHEYFFDDCDVVSHIMYYYQLHQVDYDGKTRSSPMVSAMISRDSFFETRFINILGQEVSQQSSGFSIREQRSSAGVTYSKTIKLLP